jgi:predicted esterase
MPAPAPVSAPDYTLYVPPTLPASGPVRLLVALHGIGGNGADFAKNFMPVAAARGWLMAAPTFTYGNWFDPAVVRSEDVSLSRQLVSLLGDVAQRSGRTLLPKVDIVGFSRGAQLADRFALFEPGRVQAVGSLSAGTYTLPEATLPGAAEEHALPLPFGTADMASWLGHGLDVNGLRQVRFWISVGKDDANPGDIPRQWDPVLGSTRVARAQAFERALRSAGVSAHLTVFPGAQHQLTPAMTEAVSLFLARLQRA